MPQIRTKGVFQQQAEAYLSQANPVSTTLYEVLAATKNVRIIGIDASIVWAVTQPTPLEVIVTVDGQTLIFQVANPVSGTAYSAGFYAYAADNAQVLGTTVYELSRAFLLEGRNVRVQVRITWAVTQPTPLICRVKYAKIP